MSKQHSTKRFHFMLSMYLFCVINRNAKSITVIDFKIDSCNEWDILQHELISLDMLQKR